MSDTNRAVQPQKLKLRGIDYRSADLHLCFCICKRQVFSCGLSYPNYSKGRYVFCYVVNFFQLCLKKILCINAAVHDLVQDVEAVFCLCCLFYSLMGDPIIGVGQLGCWCS